MELPDFSLDLSGLDEARAPDPEEFYDLLVLGGGPAAMTAIVYAARKMMNVAMITEDFGGQMADTTEIENYMGFQTVTGKELTQKFREQVKQFDIPIALGERVRRVRQAGEEFAVETESNRIFRARTVIIATGKRYRPLNVPGEKELVGRGVAYCATCDAPFFKDKKVVVAGGGNSAFTAALDLLKVADQVTLVNVVSDWQVDAILYQAVTRFGEKVQLLDHHRILRIEGNERVTGVAVKNLNTGGETVVPADGIFIEIGLLPNSEPVQDLVEQTPAREVIVDCRSHTSVPGLFGAGDVTTVPYKQIVISAGEGAKAALSAYDYLVGKGLL